jgi:hypothetical protein
VTADAGRENGEPRHLESPASPAAHTPAALHDDALSPVQALDESINADGAQRLGSNPAVANPITVFPEHPGDDG